MPGKPFFLGASKKVLEAQGQAENSKPVSISCLSDATGIVAFGVGRIHEMWGW